MRHCKKTATKFALMIALVAILIGQAPAPAIAQDLGPDTAVSTDTQQTNSVFLPLVRFGLKECESAGGTGSPIWTYVTGQGVDIWLTSRCPAHVHVWFRIWYSGPSCLQGYCQTSWAWMLDDWIIVNKVVIVEATNEIRINEFVEFVSVMNIPFSLDVYPWPPAENPQ